MNKAICSDANDKNGLPLWVMALDGNIFISAHAVKDAVISMQIKCRCRQTS